MTEKTKEGKIKTLIKELFALAFSSKREKEEIRKIFTPKSRYSDKQISNYKRNVRKKRNIRNKIAKHSRKNNRKNKI